MTHSEPLPLTLTFYLSICLLPSLRSLLTSLPALFPLFNFFSFFHFHVFYIAVSYVGSPFISFTKAVKFLSLSASTTSPQRRVGSVKWNERKVQTLTGFHLHAVFSRFYNNWDPDCHCVVEYLRQRDTVCSQSTGESTTPGFRLQIGIMPLGVIMISSCTVLFPVDDVTCASCMACTKPHNLNKH